MAASSDEGNIMRTALCAIVKNEVQHVAEWVIYHIDQGFDTVLIYNNGSTDGTKDVLLQMSDRIDLRVVDWPGTEPDYQKRAYDDALRRLEAGYRWVAFFDIDEYFVPDPDSSLKGILARNDSCSALAISWAVFGSSGHRLKPSGLIIEEFVFRAAETFGPNKHVKSIVNPARTIECLNPHVFLVEGSYCDIAGNAIVWDEPGVATAPIMSPAKLHHYFVRSEEHWSEKMRRGYHDTSRSKLLFGSYDRNEISDRSAARNAERIKEALKVFDLGAVLKKERSLLGSFVLITEHDTIVCFDVKLGCLIHRDLRNLEDHAVVFLHANGLAVSLQAQTADRVIHINPVTCSQARVVIDGDWGIVRQGAGWALEVAGGSYMSARQGGAVVSSVRALGSWEIFTLLAGPAAHDLLKISTEQWALKTPLEIQAPSLIHIKNRDSIQIGSKQYPIRENFPLVLSNNLMQEYLTNIVVLRKGWVIDEYSRYKPLVFLCCFGRGAVLDQMKCAISSLVEFGEYDGDVLLITDSAEKRNVIEPEKKERLFIEITTAYDRTDMLAARAVIADTERFKGYAPVLYMDIDVVVDAPIQKTLVSLLADNKISAQEEDFHYLSDASAVGSDLFASDGCEVKGLKGFNSGVIGFPNMCAAKRVLKLTQTVLGEYVGKYGREALWWVDQPVLNYVIRKLNLFKAEPLTSAIRTPPDYSDGIGQCCGFVHFWTCDGSAAKADAMAAYIGRLRQISESKTLPAS